MTALDTHAADAAMREIAARYADADTAQFAIGDFRDWLREAASAADVVESTEEPTP